MVKLKGETVGIFYGRKLQVTLILEIIPGENKLNLGVEVDADKVINAFQSFVDPEIVMFFSGLIENLKEQK